MKYALSCYRPLLRWFLLPPAFAGNRGRFLKIADYRYDRYPLLRWVFLRWVLRIFEV